MEAMLEREIRRLPQVLSCAVTPTDIVVLVHPSADPAAVEREVSRILERVGGEMRLKVLGEARLPEERGRRRLFVSRALVAALVGVGATVTISVVLPGPASRPPSALAPATQLENAGTGSISPPARVEEPSLVAPAEPSASAFGYSVRVLLPARAPDVAPPPFVPADLTPKVVPLDLPEAPAPEVSAPAPEVDAPAISSHHSPRKSSKAPEGSETESSHEGHHHHGAVHRHPPVPGPHPHGAVHRHPPVPVGAAGGGQGPSAASPKATAGPHGAGEGGGDAPPASPPDEGQGASVKGGPTGEPPGRAVGRGGHDGRGAGH